MRNLEIKCQTDGCDALRLAPEALGAVRQVPVLRQVGWYFAVPRGRLKLRQEDGGSGELIFYVRPATRDRRFSVYQRLPLTDVPAAKGLLAAALGEVICVRKRREVWLFRNARIHLDRVTKLGTFVEIEVVVRRGTKQARALMNELVRKLKVKRTAVVGGSYADLLINRPGVSRKC